MALELRRHYFFLSKHLRCGRTEITARRHQQPATGWTRQQSCPTVCVEVLKGPRLADTSVLDDPREALRPGLSFRLLRERYQASVRNSEKALADKQVTVDRLARLEKPRSVGPYGFRRRPGFAHHARCFCWTSDFPPAVAVAQDELNDVYRGARERKNAGNGRPRDAQGILANSGFLSPVQRNARHHGSMLARSRRVGASGNHKLHRRSSSWRFVRGFWTEVRALNA